MEAQPSSTSNPDLQLQSDENLLGLSDVHDHPSLSAPVSFREDNQSYTTNKTKRVADLTTDLAVILDGTGAARSSQKQILSEALGKANAAIELDSAQAVNGATDAYADACRLLQQAIVHGTDKKRITGLSEIRSAYLERIAELQHHHAFSVLATKDGLQTRLRALQVDPSFSFSTPKSTSDFLSSDETMELFKRKLQSAQQELESDGSPNAVNPGHTLDLSYSKLARIPEAVVDVIKDEVARLALSNNQLWHIPLRFSECSRLRYLNIRRNTFREVPRAVYNMVSLEILDLHGNKIRKISKHIQSLTSLRIFVITHNKLDELPIEMGRMDKLQILRVNDNPLKFEFRHFLEKMEVLFSKLSDNEREAAVTMGVKRYLSEYLPGHAAQTSSSVSKSLEAMMETSEEPSLRNTLPCSDESARRRPSTNTRRSDLVATETAFRDPRSSHHQYVPDDVRSTLYSEHGARDPRSSDYIAADLEGSSRSSHYFDVGNGAPRSSQYGYADEAPTRFSHVQYVESDAAAQARMSTDNCEVDRMNLDLKRL